jgi:hypothetical protein
MPTAAELTAELKRAAEANRVLRKENEKLRLEMEASRLKEENASLSHGLSFKVSPKTGGVSVYGLNAFPVTLYKEQWARLLTAAADIRKFIFENDGPELPTKAESRARKPRIVKTERRRA